MSLNALKTYDYVPGVFFLQNELYIRRMEKKKNYNSFRIYTLHGSDSSLIAIYI